VRISSRRASAALPHTVAGLSEGLIWNGRHLAHRGDTLSFSVTLRSASQATLPRMAGRPAWQVTKTSERAALPLARSHRAASHEGLAIDRCARPDNRRRRRCE
jgi:hypothetical protein